MRRMRDLMSGIRCVRQRRRMLMVRRRGCVAMMMMGRRVYVTVAVTHRVRVMRSGCAVHIVQQIVVRRQRVVIQVQDVRQEGFTTPLVQLQITVRLTRTLRRHPRNN